MPRAITRWQCTICGTSYAKKEKAIECEAIPVEEGWFERGNLLYEQATLANNLLILGLFKYPRNQGLPIYEIKRRKVRLVVDWQTQERKHVPFYRTSYVHHTGSDINMKSGRELLSRGVLPLAELDYALAIEEAWQILLESPGLMRQLYKTADPRVAQAHQDEVEELLSQALEQELERFGR